MRIRTILALGCFIVVLLLAAGLASCKNPDQRPMDTWFTMLPTPLPESPVGLIVTDPVFRQKEPDPLIEQAYLAAAIHPKTSKDLWGYFSNATQRVDIVGTQITSPDMTARLVGLAGKGVPVNIVVEQGYFDQAESAPLISQLVQTGRITIKTDKDGITRQVHSHYAIIDDHIVLASSGDFLDKSFQLSINNTLVFDTARSYVDGSGPAGVKSVTDAFLFDFDQMFNMGKFGGDKDRLINHTFNVGVEVEIYFGPNDDLLAEVGDQVSNMQTSMAFMISQVDDPNMLGILAAFAYAGFYDRGLSGNLAAALPLATPFNWTGYNALNHKVMVIDVPADITDAMNPTLLQIYDPVVITGSNNWTQMGMKLNDEQMIVVHDLTLGFEMGFVEFSTLAREAAGIGVVFGKVRTFKNVPVPNADVSCDSNAIPATPFMGDGGNPDVEKSGPTGAYSLTVPAGFMRNIHLEGLGDADGAYLFPDPLWGTDQPNQGYNLLPGSSYQANFYLKPIPTNTGTGSGGSGGGGFGG